MTIENLNNFIKENKQSPVIQGEHLTPEFGKIKTLEDMERSDRTKYTLENKKVFIITNVEKNSSNYIPEWKY